MDSVKICLFISIWLVSVLHCSGNCYYTNSRYECFEDYEDWDSSQKIGAAIGGGISLIVGIIVFVGICRLCTARRASQGSVLTNNTIPTVTTQNPYYPQNTQQYPYGQPWGQPQWGQQPMRQQPIGQQPFTGYSNTALGPPKNVLLQ